MSSAELVSIRPPRPVEGGGATNPFLPLLERQRQAFRREATPSARERREALEKLARALGKHADRLVKAVQADFGHRSPHETLASEVLGALAEIRFTKGKIERWMKPKRSWLGLSGAELSYRPKGVVGIIGAWNYPAMLVLSPLVGALAAGNRAIIKPPDVTPRTSDVLAEMIGECFDPSHVAVVTGDVEAAVQFSELPFDHLIYTGNTEIGRRVMMAAARNLTPVTLEMGGKSPTIISDDFPIDRAVTRILMGKSINSGQTCIAPDYVLIHRSREQEFVDAWVRAVSRRYPRIAENPDITWIVNDRHYRRLRALIEDARARGAKVVEVNPAHEEIPEGRRIVPHTVLTDVSDDMRVMQEEIFGPVLPVRSVGSTEEALEYVRSRPRPLAFYYFDVDKRRARRAVNEILSGGVCVNDTVLHVGNFNLPFGGTGESGVGAYHGFYGFAEFSHKQAVYFQSRWLSPASLLAGPYPERAYGWLERAVRFLSR